MKLPTIPGLVHKVAPVRRVNRGFTQVVIVNQPEQKDDQGYRKRKEQFFVIHIWSNKEADSRFLKKEFEGSECFASCYLDGQRWEDRTGFQYSHKMNLDTWLDKDGKPFNKDK